MSQEHRTLRVAISGGGMAGSCLVHALLKCPNLDVHIFESAPTFKEPGIAIGLARNAKQSLDLIGPSATHSLERAGGVALTALHWVMGRGVDTDKLICRTEHKNGGDLAYIVQRASFIRELLADVPPSRMHASKKLDKFTKLDNGSIALDFTDGTTHECDILIGADGIRSRVRQLILGEDDPAAYPVATPWWFRQRLVPYDEAQRVLGKDVVDINNHIEYGYCGRGTFWLHNILSGGKEVQTAVVAKCDVDSNSGEWRRDVSTEELQDRFSSSPPLIRNAVKQIMCDEPSMQAFYMWEHLHARRYANGPVCMIGDAAHSATPWQASGAGMSVEDSYILSNLLGRAKSPAEALVALEVYDQIRRPRTQQIVDSSRRTGHIFTGSCNDFDVDSLKEMKENLQHRWDFIYYIDMQKHLDEALELMDKAL